MNAATAIKDRGNMNSAYDDLERPPTPSFSGDYFSNYQPKPTSPYLFGAGEPVNNKVPISSSTVEFLPPKENPKKALCTVHRLLIVLLLLFIVLSVVMIVLYIGKSSRTDKDRGTENPENEAIEKPSIAPCLCRQVPPPVAFKTLPNTLQAELKALESLIEQHVQKHKPGALTANIVYRDKVIWKGQFGTTGKSTTQNSRPTEKTVFPVASLTKVLTAIMLYKLYDSGLVTSLDDPVTRYAPDFFVNNPFNAAITLRELASHRSGLQREAPCYPDTKINLCPYTNSEMMQRLRNLTLLRRPGSDPHYSNLGFALLGQVLGNRFGNSYEEWMRINMLSTLQMSDTVFEVDQRLEERIPVGYFSSYEFANVLEWGWLNPTGGAFSTVADFAKIEMALFNDGFNRYLSEAVTEELFSAGYILPSGKDIVGTPWEMEVAHDLILRRKGGHIYGYSSRMILVPEIKLAFNFFCTNCNLYAKVIDQKFSKDFLSTFKENLREEVLREVNTPPETKKYTGIYRVDGLGSLKYIEVKMKEGNLHLLLNGVADDFVLNYTRPLNFKIIVQQKLPCMQIFVHGLDKDRVVFDAPSKDDGLCDRFTMYGAHPSGRTYFYRNRTQDSRA